MGCGTSASAVKVEKLAPVTSNSESSLYTYTGEKSPERAFNFIIEKLDSFSCASGMVPTLCLSGHSFPLITAKLTQDQEDEVDIELPVLTGAFYGKGRVISFPHIALFSEMGHVPYSNLYRKAFDWIGETDQPMSLVLLYNFPKEIIKKATKIFHSLSYFVETQERKLENIDKYKIICIPSSVDFDDVNLVNRFTEYVENGGGLAIFFTPESADNPLSFPINPLLLNFGLAYTFCSISEGSNVFPISTNFNDVKNYSYSYFIDQLKQIFSKPNNVDIGELEKITTILRYHNIVVGDQQMSLLNSLSDACWAYLDETHVIVDNLFCTDQRHVIILVMMIEVIQNLHPSMYHPIPGYEIFPGSCEENAYEEASMTLELTAESWISTGLYLPPGQNGKIESSPTQRDSNIHFQIGAHHENLLPKPSPWKRWPLIVLPFAKQKGITEVASPFGGPLYVAANEELGGNVQVQIKATGFVKYPRWVYNDPKVWEESKDKKAPFGEIECRHIIFTLPTDMMKQLNFEQIHKAMESITLSISSFFSHAITKKFRVVFDIELLDEEPAVGYPIVIEIDEIFPMLKNIDKPSRSLFRLSTLLGISNLREGCFDATIEQALASISSSNAFVSLYPDFDPLNYEGFMMPPLFEELWHITQKFDSMIIPKTLIKFQNPSYELPGIPEDTWIDFVREMCRIGETDFTKLLEKSRPIPLNVSMSCHGFPEFVDDDGQAPTS